MFQYYLKYIIWKFQLSLKSIQISLRNINTTLVSEKESNSCLIETMLTPLKDKLEIRLPRFCLIVRKHCSSIKGKTTNFVLSLVTIHIASSLLSVVTIKNLKWSFTTFFRNGAISRIKFNIKSYSLQSKYKIPIQNLKIFYLKVLKMQYLMTFLLFYNNYYYFIKRKPKSVLIFPYVPLRHHPTCVRHDLKSLWSLETLQNRGQVCEWSQMPGFQSWLYYLLAVWYWVS